MTEINSNNSNNNLSYSNDNNNNTLNISSSLQNNNNNSNMNLSEPIIRKKKGKENWQFICHPINKEAALEIIMKPHKHVVKHTTKLIRGMSATYQCTVHVACQHAYKLVEKSFPDHVQWTLSELNTHSDIPAPKPRGIDPVIRAKVDEFAIMGASPMHILESLSALGDFKGVDLPTRDQISNRIHGRESKKRKLQMEAALNNQRNIKQSSFQQPTLGVHQHHQQFQHSQQQILQNQKSQLQPQQEQEQEQQQQQQQQQQHFKATQQAISPQFVDLSPTNQLDYELSSIDSYEQAYLDMFGPQLLYHSVYYPEYGLGMVVSSPSDVIMSGLNLNYSTAPTIPLSSTNNSNSSLSSTVSNLSSIDDKSISNDSNKNSSLPANLKNSSSYVSPSVPSSVPLAGSSIPISIQSTFPPQWTLLFLHTPPDHNGLYMQCPLGCSGCVNGKIHLFVNRTILLAGLMGAVEIANSNNYTPEDVLHCYDDHHHQCQQQPSSQIYQQQQLQQQQESQKQESQKQEKQEPQLESPSNQFYELMSKLPPNFSSVPTSVPFPSFVTYNTNDNNNNHNDVNNLNNLNNINNNINNTIIQQQ